MERAISDNDQNDMPETYRDRVDALRAVIVLDIGDGEEEFDDGFGNLIDDMHDALAALHRVARARYTLKHDPKVNSCEAARKLVRVQEAIEELVARGQRVKER